MALTAALVASGHNPQRVQTVARVHLNLIPGGCEIPAIDLTTEAEVSGLDDATFQTHAADAKENCPVSKVLAGAEISLRGRLIG